MRLKVYILLFQFFIFGNKWRYSNAKAMIGHDIRSASENEFPSVVCIFKYDPDEPWQNNLLCTGTLISTTHILTAEHCFHGADLNKIEVTVGGHSIDDGIRYYPIWWISYNQWTSRRSQRYSVIHDILIIKIFGISLNVGHCLIGYVHPISSIVGQSLEVVGCGRIGDNEYPTILKTASINVLDNFFCEEKVSYYYGNQINIDQQVICTANEPYTLVDQGDSGGPLFYNGITVGVTVARCPALDAQYYSEQVNIHLDLYFYQSYIYSILDM